MIVSCAKCDGSGLICPKCGARRKPHHACGYSRLGRGRGCGTRARGIPCPGFTPPAEVTGRAVPPTVPHFATFVQCDVCQVRALNTSSIPGGWAYERRSSFQGGAGNPLILCDECVPKLEALRLTVIDRLLETRGGLNSNRRWDRPGSPKYGPDCPKEIRDWNARETLGEAHRALLELQVREFEGLPAVPRVPLMPPGQTWRADG